MKLIIFFVLDQLFRFPSIIPRFILVYSSKVDKTPYPVGYIGFLFLGLVPEPHTVDRRIRALPAGSYLFAQKGDLEKPEYWLLRELLSDKKHFFASKKIDPIKVIIDESIDSYLLSDGPLGEFMSGGLYSSIISSVAESKSRVVTHIIPGFIEHLKIEYFQVPFAKK